MLHSVPESEGDCPHHLMISCNGRMYVVDTMDESGQLVTPPEWEVRLRYIWDKAHQDGTGPGIAALTADDRISWHKAGGQIGALNIRTNSIRFKNKKKTFPSFVSFITVLQPSFWAQECNI